MAEFDPVAVLTALERHDVRYVLIGGVAARLAGAPIVTGDVDITPAVDDANLERLVAALDELGASVRIGSVETDEPVTADVIRHNDIVQAATHHGYLKIVASPAGTTGFDDLARGASREEIAPGLKVQVASLADVIRSKQATGRAKDQGQLPILRETLERLRG